MDNMSGWDPIPKLTCKSYILPNAEANSPTRHLPLEIIQEIYWHLTPSEYDSARLVCNRWFRASLSSPLILYFLRTMNFPSNIRSFSESKLQRWKLGDLRLVFAFAIDQWGGSRFRACYKKTDLNLSTILRNTHIDSGYSSREIEFLNFSKNPGGYMGMVTRTIEGSSKVQRTLWVHRITPIDRPSGPPILGSEGWHEDSGLIPMWGVDERPGKLYLTMELKKCPDQPILGLDIEPGGSEPGIMKIRVRYLNSQESVSFDCPLQIGHTRSGNELYLEDSPYEILCRSPGITYRTGSYRIPGCNTCDDSGPNISRKVLRAIFGSLGCSHNCSVPREPANSLSRQAPRFILGSFVPVTRATQTLSEQHATTYVTLPQVLPMFHRPEVIHDQTLRLPRVHVIPKPRPPTLRERIGKLCHKVAVPNPGPLRSLKMANMPFSHTAMAMIGDDPVRQMCHRLDIPLESETCTVLITAKNGIIICSISGPTLDIGGVEVLDACYSLAPPPRMSEKATRITHIAIAPWHEHCYFGHGLKWWNMGICAGYNNGEVWFWKVDMENLRQKIPASGYFGRCHTEASPPALGASGLPSPSSPISGSLSGSLYLPLPYFAPRGECQSMPLGELVYTTGKKDRQTRVHLPLAGFKKAESWILGFMPGLMKLSFIGRGKMVAAVTEKNVVIFDMRRGGGYETGSVKGIFR